jgi:A/G-specific adenine glycosylase
MNRKEQAFIALVWAFYEKEGRHALPWRKTRDPYRILVSEVMLQQTQVDRVLPKYRAFIRAFPSISALARSPLKDVLIAWQGLGYNRRAKLLHSCASVIAHEHRGKFPRTKEELQTLPGIGPYTASAVLAFSFEVPTALIETNVRSVFLHHFFADDADVPDAALLPYIERTLQKERVREWYWALMDYGSFLKRHTENPSRRSRHHTKQSPFKGSDRSIRGAIVRMLTQGPLTRTEILARLKEFEDVRIDAILQRLCEEGLVAKGKRGMYALP